MFDKEKTQERLSKLFGGVTVLKVVELLNKKEGKRKMKVERKKMEENFEDERRKMNMKVVFMDEMKGGKK
ncbi:hypothetical protein Cni_G16014 [Canna indica]|uniref:Uncharacterized protein n=1 Tax=Canna indica TaxID=4628 RepID=A0AAQ3QDV2_9LILI|nr:hypothetical protein Cni_G16014 [Canna indica]